MLAIPQKSRMNRTQKQAGKSIAKKGAQQRRTEAGFGILHGDGLRANAHCDLHKHLVVSFEKNISKEKGFIKKKCVMRANFSLHDAFSAF